MTTTRDPNTWIAGEIRAQLGRAGISQHALAGMLGVKPQTLSSRLRGGSELRVRELLAVAEALGVPVTEFLPPPSPRPARALLRRQKA